MGIRISELISEYGKRFKEKYFSKLSKVQKEAYYAVKRCRTSKCGEMIAICNDCKEYEFKPHSCGNRSCPRCKSDLSSIWLKRQIEKLLPVNYFMVTFTIPFELRKLAWNHQKLFYDNLFSSSIEALKELGKEKNRLNGDLGASGILHTHSRRLDYHPHIHFIIPGGGWNRENNFWVSSKGKYLFPYKKLSYLYKRNLINGLKKSGLEIPDSVKFIEWGVNCKDVGKGKSSLKYLSRYLYRGVISEKKIRKIGNDKVQFFWTDSETKKEKSKILKGEDFLFLFFRHVLPKGYRRVRDFGFLHGNAKKVLSLIQNFLKAVISVVIEIKKKKFRCSKCGGEMRVIAFNLKPYRRNKDPPFKRVYPKNKLLLKSKI